MSNILDDSSRTSVTSQFAQKEVLSSPTVLVGLILLQEGRQNRIVIKELDPRAVRDMVGYLYTGSVKAETWDDDDLCLGLLQAAHCYKVDSLVVSCAEIIGKRLVLATVCDRLEFADLLGCESLKSRCLSFIYQHMAEVQITEAYAKLCRRPSLLMDIIAVLSPPTKRRKTDLD